ncbi:MAG: site-specific integrase [Lachnospiraceae bacterium]|nr:site-specific integrase [Lachnospiraceae bacterium]
MAAHQVMRDIERLYNETVQKELNIDFAALQSMDESSKTSVLSEVRKSVFMNIVAKVQKVHPYAICPGTEKDPRWYTYVKENVRGERRKIRANSEEELYKGLYVFYYGSTIKRREFSLQQLYPEWIRYKSKTANRQNTVKKLATDYRTYYLNEPISKTVLTKPLRKLTMIEIEEWAYEMIKKYEFTRQRFINVFTVLRQSMGYMVASDYMKVNICANVQIRQNSFKKNRKKPASTQIFYPEEAKELLEYAEQEAERKKNEVYLAIPLLYYTGTRISECLGLGFEDFEKKLNVIHIHRSMVTIDELLPNGTWAPRRFEVQEYLKQNADPRDVIVCDKCFDVVEKIRQMLADKGIERELLFDTLTPNSLRTKVYKMCRDLEMERKSPHKFRKTFISRLLNSGADVDFVREQAGHQQITTTYNAYVFSTSRDEEKIRLVNQLA